TAAGTVYFAGGVSVGGAPASMTVTLGSSQSTQVGKAFPSALQVTVKDASGNPVSGVPVTFTAPAGGAGAALSASTVFTNLSGVAGVTATANNQPGSYTVTATLNNLTALFLLTNLQGSANPNLAQGRPA